MPQKEAFGLGSPQTFVSSVHAGASVPISLSLVTDPFLPHWHQLKVPSPPDSGCQSSWVIWHSLCLFARFLQVSLSSQLLQSPSQGHTRHFHLLSCANLDLWGTRNDCHRPPLSKTAHSVSVLLLLYWTAAIPISSRQ